MPWVAPLSGKSVSLSRRTIYMLPTRHGFMFSLLLFVLLLAAINYENGLIYALTFWLASMAMISMLHTHRNLLGLKISAGPCAPVFAGESARFTLILKNELALPRQGLSVLVDKNEVGRVDLGAGEQGSVTFPVNARQRGYVDMPPVALLTDYPMGLLYTWSRKIELHHRCLVYPKPGPARPVVGGVDSQQKRELGTRSEGDDFIGVREYQAGDSPRHVDWKAAARGQGLQTKRFGGDARSIIWLDWEALEGIDTETRLSQLCRWVIDAEADGMIYGLRLPGREIKPANGEAHRHQCLEALAMFGH
ncbi:MAG: hypothetical protein AMJ68_04260 [Acidithiobacillales bacterium SG8_45]|nr:MAG: hypothetical protein AMJ68_04260 [Acidithiobacillales bacterium SG8_45]